MKKKIWITVLILACFGGAFSQSQQDIFMGGSSVNFKNRFFIALTPYTNAFYASNVLSNSCFRKIIYGGYIEDSEKDKILNRFRTSGRVGYEWRYGLNMKYSFGSSHLLGITVENRDFLSLLCSEATLRTILYGNFYSDTIALGTNTLRQIRYQKIGLGYGYDKKWNRFALTLNMNVYFLAGIRNRYFESKNAQMAVGFYGEFLNLSGDFAYQNTDSPAFYKGSGIGGDIKLRTVFSCSSQSQGNSYVAVTLSAEDMGWISWRKNSYLTKQNYSLNYQGMAFSGVSFSGFSIKDSLINLIADSLKTGRISNYTPSHIGLSVTYHREFNSQKRLDACGVNTIFNVYFFSAAKPYAEIEPYLIFRMAKTHRLKMGIPFSYGCFGSFSMGLDMKYQTPAIAIQNRQTPQMEIDVGLNIKQIGLNSGGLYASLYCILKFYKS